MIILSDLMLVLLIVDLRLFFLLIHRNLLVVDWLIVLHLVVFTEIVTLFIDLLLRLFSVDVVLVSHVLIAFVIRSAFLHFTFFLILLMCVAVVVLLVGHIILLINQLVHLILILFHVLVIRTIHTKHLLGVVHVAVHLT